MKPQIIGISLSLLGLSACSSQANIDMQTFIEAQSNWHISSIADKPTLQGLQTSLQFSAGKVTGHSGCNRFFANYQIKGGQIAFGPIGSTRMACADDAMQQESRLFQALAQPLDIVQDKQTLLLSHGKDSSLRLEAVNAE